MQENVLVRLRHMLDAAREAAGFLSGKTRSDLNTDRMLVLTLLKEIEIVGEAASRVSLEGRAECDCVPWRDIIDMRNHLMHVYFDIDLDTVWKTASEDLPLLAEALERFLAHGSEGSC